MDMSDVAAARDQLREVLARGAHAQAEYATALMERLDGLDGVLPEELANDIALLSDAHLHDPYLTRVTR